MKLSPRALTALATAALAASAAAACSEPDYDSLRRRPDGPGGPSDFTSPTNPPGDVGNVAIHRLNGSEYDNTVRDLLGDTSKPSAAFPPDYGADSFTNNADALAISPILFEQYDAAAEKLSTAALANKAIVTCDDKTMAADACAKQILGGFLKRAWRRPVADDEIASLAGLVAVAAAENEPFSKGIQLALKAALLSPNFLFRIEIDPDPNSTEAHPLGDYELASRLSYFLWSSMPDDALFAAAEAGKLAKDKGELESQVTRMLADPKAHALLDEFAAQWLMHGLEDAKPSAETFPEWNEGLREAMAEETKAFVGSFLFGDESMMNLLSANYTYLNGRLATHYGIPGATGTEFVRVPLAAETHRGGILTHGSVTTMTAIATRTSPVRRGQWVLSELLCAPPPPPPPNVPALPATSGSGTMRQKMEEHRKNPACSSCHSAMDPIGLALEHFDGIGRWRDTDDGQPIDASGQLGTAGAKFDGAVSLSNVIQKDPRFVRCATQKVFTFALGRKAVDADNARLDALTKGFGDAQHRMKALIREVVLNDAFRMRRGGNQE